MKHHSFLLGLSNVASIGPVYEGTVFLVIISALSLSLSPQKDTKLTCSKYALSFDPARVVTIGCHTSRGGCQPVPSAPGRRDEVISGGSRAPSGASSYRTQRNGGTG